MNKLERNEDQKVQPDIRKGQSAVVRGIGKAYDGGVGALERYHVACPTSACMFSARVVRPTCCGHSHTASDGVGGGEYVPCE